MSHINAIPCPSCDAKLELAHPELVEFANSFRAANPDAHISCSNRTEAEQEADFAKGTTRAHWGQSPHDYNPALALDWFRLTEQGAGFDATWFQDVLAPAAAADGLVWGGKFSSIRDMPHVELPNWREIAGLD